jgi:CRISPR-associated protein Csd1
MIGYSGEEDERPLLPICHITAQAHIEIIINDEGNFLRAQIINNKNDATTIIPCTEESASKVGIKPACHPLCDKLQYVAGDYSKYGGTVTSGFLSDPEEPYRNYIEILGKWCESEFAHPKAEAVLKYAKKKTLIRDLVEYRLLFIGNDGKFLGKDQIKREKGTVDIFSVINSQENAFVRWMVEQPGDLETKVWKDKTLWESWIKYYLSTKRKESICFVTGEEAVLTNNHPKYIRVKGDGAKLISSNDTTGFTYRGRFQVDGQACNVSLEVSQKAHNALLWLINRQGKVFWVKGKGGRKDPSLAIVAWGTSNIIIPQPTDDSLDILLYGSLPNEEIELPNTAQNFALQLRKKILGYNASVNILKSVQIMAMNSASKGRLAIIYYQELDISDYLDRINKWHEECAWIHRYRPKQEQNNNTNTEEKKYYTFIGAPAPSDIAGAAYGEKVDDKLKNITILRILPCIIDGTQLPRDLVESAVRRASNRIGMEKWEWEKALSIACALFKKYNRKENYQMALEENRKTRDYLYGRLLALAESLEKWALDISHENRDTNAARLMQRFAERPYSTWRTIELSLAPYKARLGGKSIKRQRMIDDVIASFNPEDFISDKRLSGEFLLGYHCQRAALRSSSDQSDDSETKEL